MKKELVGSIIFWLAVIWIFLWGIIGSLYVSPEYRNLSLTELNQTLWALGSIWVMIWGIYGASLGAIIALFGIMLNSGAKISTAFAYAVGLFIVMIAGMMLSIIAHIPLLFGIGGTVMLLCFVGILKMWGKERKLLKDESPLSLDLKLVSYVFFIISAWFTCGIASVPFLKAMEDIDQSTPIHVITFFTLGWIFLFLSHYKAKR